MSVSGGALDRLALWEYGRRSRIGFPEEARFREFARRFVALDSLLGETE
jgi:hypothetical protein